MDEIAASWVDGLLRWRRFSPGKDDASVPVTGNCGAMGTYRHADDGWDTT